MPDASFDTATLQCCSVIAILLAYLEAHGVFDDLAVPWRQVFCHRLFEETGGVHAAHPAEFIEDCSARHSGRGTALEDAHVTVQLLTKYFIPLWFYGVEF